MVTSLNFRKSGFGVKSQLILLISFNSPYFRKSGFGVKSQLEPAELNYMMHFRKSGFGVKSQLSRTNALYELYFRKSGFGVKSQLYWDVWFIEFILKSIRDELIVGINDGISVGIKLSKTEHLVLKEIEIDNNITAILLAEKTGKSVRTIERIIKKLRENHIINREGSRKSGHWVLMKDNKR